MNQIISSLNDKFLSISIFMYFSKALDVVDVDTYNMQQQLPRQPPTRVG